jgi:hypothetical protein
MLAEILTAVVAGGLSGAVAVNLERAKLKTQYRAEAAIRQLLLHKRFRQRSFEQIQFRLPGFDPDELRQLLIRAGAVRIRDESGQNRELWGLVKRNAHVLQ